MATTVLLVRHGETALNRSGALRGRLDVPLSANGLREAQQLARRVAAEYSLAAIYTSPLRRARETAEAISQAVRLEVQTDDRFTDLEYGQWAGRTPEEFSAQEQAELRRWYQHPEMALPGAEDPVTAQQRAWAGLCDRAAAGGCVAIVAHDAILQLLLCSVLDVELCSYRGLAQHTATLNELEHTGGRWRVRLLNSAWHLDDLSP